MLKRTITLVGLTITLGALILALGCSGSNNIVTPALDGSSDQDILATLQPGRGAGDAVVTLQKGSPVYAVITDKDGISFLSVRRFYSNGSWQTEYYRLRNNPTSFKVLLRDFDKVTQYTIIVANPPAGFDSVWRVIPPETVVKDF